MCADSRSEAEQATAVPFATAFERAEFEPIAKAPDCEYCGDARRSMAFAPFFDAVYCLSLREQPHRTAAITDLLHRLGLCGNVTFMRPSRAKHVARGIWKNHQAMARHAIYRGCRKALMLEDDAYIGVGHDRLQVVLQKAMARLPQDWQGLYLGHMPLQAYPIGGRLLRARSGAAHAYIASERLLSWLAETEPTDPEVPVCRTIGRTLDGALANLPGMYAVFPMVATQRFMGDYCYDPNFDERGRKRKLTDRMRYRTFMICKLMRTSEVLAVLFAPWHWLTLEYFRRRSGLAFQRAARAIIRASNGFDEEYYLRTYPDIRECGRLPIEHYINDGVREGRRPNSNAAPLAPQQRARGPRSMDMLFRALLRLGPRSADSR